MAQTVVPFGDPKAVKRWSGQLSVDQIKKSYFDKKFIGTGPNNIIEKKTDLEKAAGDTISFDLSVQLRGEATEGDDRLEGKEENLKFYTDQVTIDQTRKAASAGGQMTRKRTVHNMRSIARDRLSDYWARFNDEIMFMYLSGARGINEDFLFPVDYAGRASNAFDAPDADHLMYGGSATSKASLVAGDKMTTTLIERAEVKASMLQASNPDAANMVPVTIEGEEHYVLLMNPFQAHDLRTDAGSGWLDIQKAAAAAEGRNNPIFKGGLGMVKNVVLHQHRNGIRFNDYGAGADVEAARALFMGRQAGVCAYGSSEGMRYSWKEELKDYENEPSVASGTITGFKKSRFNNKDFGVITLDTAAADPN
jgi:N4-gp56 family major capsid protein